MSQTTNRLIKEMAETRRQQIDRETINAKDQQPREVKVATLGGKPIRHALRELARLSALVERQRQILNTAGYESPQLKAFLCHCDEDAEQEAGESIAGVRTLQRIYKSWLAEQTKLDAANRLRRNKVEALSQKVMIDTISMHPSQLAVRMRKFADDLAGV